ncbi:MAG: CHAP domain-containing protein, partial [Ktedonobacteraceae bacterium]|nr:CHAP domain-containing protein [Ktedonobacteraceae bacterium]
MPFVDNNAKDQSSVTTVPNTPPVEQMPFPGQEVEQLPFPVPASPLPDEQLPFPGEQSTPYEGLQQLAMPQTQMPALPQTGQIRVLPQQLESQTGTTASQRKPMVIRGSGKKRPAPARPSIRRRLLIQLVVIGLLIFIMGGTALAVTPIDSQGHSALSLLQPNLNSIVAKNHNTTQLAQQAATATAIISQPGFDPGPPQGYVPPGSDVMNRFTYGQCTYWADERYFQLTGVRVPWMGNAYQWAAGASQYGWTVSSTPKVPSIIVLQPGTQYASAAYGHVAVVERINSDGSVYTSNWNWGGGYAQTTYVTFKPGPGVSFV